MTVEQELRERYASLADAVTPGSLDLASIEATASRRRRSRRLVVGGSVVLAVALATVPISLVTAADGVPEPSETDAFASEAPITDPDAALIAAAADCVPNRDTTRDFDVPGPSESPKDAAALVLPKRLTLVEVFGDEIEGQRRIVGIDATGVAVSVVSVAQQRGGWWAQWAADCD